MISASDQRQTERLILRRWKPEDLDPFAALGADAEVMEYFPALLTRDQSRKLIEKIEAKFERQGFGMWAVELKENGAFIGFVGLNVPDFKAVFTPCVEVGWRLARQHWGNGYATEAGKACLGYAFAHGIDEVLAWTIRGNHRSMRVMERIGMHRSLEDDFDHPDLPARHKLRPHVLYRIKKPGA